MPSDIPSTAFVVAGSSARITGTISGLVATHAVMERGPFAADDQILVNIQLVTAGSDTNFTIAVNPLDVAVPGIFDSVVRFINAGGTFRRLPLRWYVTGGKFLGPIHSDASARDVVLDLRTAPVTADGWYFIEPDGLAVNLGASVDLRILLQTGPTVFAAGATNLRLEISLRNNFDAAPLLTLAAAAPTAGADSTLNIYGYVLNWYLLPARFDGVELRAVFAALNAPVEGNESTQTLALQGVVSCLIGGNRVRCRPFPITCRQ